MFTHRVKFLFGEEGGRVWLAMAAFAFSKLPYFFLTQYLIFHCNVLLRTRHSDNVDRPVTGHWNDLENSSIWLRTADRSNEGCRTDPSSLSPPKEPSMTGCFINLLDKGQRKLVGGRGLDIVMMTAEGCSDLVLSLWEKNKCRPCTSCVLFFVKSSIVRSKRNTSDVLLLTQHPRGGRTDLNFCVGKRMFCSICC